MVCQVRLLTQHRKAGVILKIFALADLHLSFGVDKPMDVFGNRWAGHTERIKNNWMETVSDSDTVIIPGDVSWGLKFSEAESDLKWIHELPGKKVLTKGNHDPWWTSVTKLNSLYEDIIFLQNDYYDLSGGSNSTDLCLCGSRGWILPCSTAEWTDHDEKILKRELIRLRLSLEKAKSAGFKRFIVSVHYPPLDGRGSDSCFTELLEQYPVMYVVYGHLHGEEAGRQSFSGEKNGIEYRLVSSDSLKFKPYFILEQ